MRIIVLAHNLRVAGGLSVGQNVVASLSEAGPSHEYLFVLPTGVGYESLKFPPRSEVYFYGRAGGDIGQIWFEERVLPRIARQFRADVIWGLGNFCLRRPPCRQALLLQTTQLLYGREHMPRYTVGERLKLWLMRRRIVSALPVTQIVFCQTETVAKRFRQRFRFSGRISIMPNAISRFAVNQPDVVPPIFSQLRGKLVLFCLAKYYPHKNLESIVELFLRHGDQLRDVVVLFTVAPQHYPHAPGFLKQIRNPALQQNLINIGPLAQHELSGYYRHSSALILPTLLESFTATYLEAMQFDCPILTSDLDFAREVCGDAAIYFDPWNVDSMRDAIVRFRDELSLQQHLREQGLHQLQQKFPTWREITAEALYHLAAIVDSPEKELVA